MEGLVFDGMVEYVAASLILVVAQFVYALFGFGAGLIAVASLTFLGLPLQDVVVLMLLINLPVELVLVVRQRRSVSWRGAVGIGVGVACGVPVGTWLLRNGQTHGLLAGLGTFLIVSGALFLALPSLRPIHWPRWSTLLVGGVAGVFGGLFGTAGPPVIVYHRLAATPKTKFRATLLAVFFGMTLLRIGTYGSAGLLTQTRALSALALAPAVVVGVWLGQHTHIEISEQRFRNMVSVALLLIGILLVLRAASA